MEQQQIRKLWKRSSTTNNRSNYWIIHLWGSKKYQTSNEKTLQNENNGMFMRYDKTFNIDQRKQYFADKTVWE